MSARKPPREPMFSPWLIVFAWTSGVLVGLPLGVGFAVLRWVP